VSTLRTDVITAVGGAGTISVPAGNALGIPGYIVQIQFKVFSEQTALSIIQTYTVGTNATLAITSKFANSKFYVNMQAQGFALSTGGTNIGISRTIGATTTRLIGTDGAAGDTWMGNANGQGTNSWNIKRPFLDSPGVAAGTTITYNMLLGLWSAGTTYLNNTGYTGGSTITIMEIAP
jgi:ribulose 1,5-bisphosphate carboxylase large subunit-like protein